MISSNPMRPILLVGLMAAVLALAPTETDAATLHLTGPAGAEVFVNEEAIGFLPLSEPLALNPGRYLVRCELPGHQPFEAAVRFLGPDESRRIQARLMPLRRRTAVMSNLLFAGLGQHYSGQSLRGWIYNAAEVGGLLTAVAAELRRSDFRKDYLLLMDKYDQEINANQIAYYKSEAQAAFSDMEDMEQLRATGLWVAGGAVLLSVFDSLAFFPSFEAGSGTPVALASSIQESPFARRPSAAAFHLGYRKTF